MDDLDIEDWGAEDSNGDDETELGKDSELEVNNDEEIMRKFGITNNLFYTIFSAPLQYFRITLLSLLFMDVLVEVKRTSYIILIVIITLNRLLSLSNHVFFNFIELVLTTIMVTVFFLMFDSLAQKNISKNEAVVHKKVVELEDLEKELDEEFMDSPMKLDDVIEMIKSTNGAVKSVESLRGPAEFSANAVNLLFSNTYFED